MFISRVHVAEMRASRAPYPPPHGSGSRAIKGFVANAPNKTKLRQGIRQSFALVAAMVKAHPCLKIDFQVYLRNDGAMLNIDLDRCDEFNPRTLEPLNALQKLELAQIPGLCRRGSDQVVLDKVLGELHERLRHSIGLPMNARGNLASATTSYSRQ